MEYTKNYHLPQWVKEDRIMMDDFNAAMSSLENGLTGLDRKMGGGTDLTWNAILRTGWRMMEDHHELADPTEIYSRDGLTINPLSSEEMAGDFSGIVWREGAGVHAGKGPEVPLDVLHATCTGITCGTLSKDTPKDEFRTATYSFTAPLTGRITGFTLYYHLTYTPNDETPGYTHYTGYGSLTVEEKNGTAWKTVYQRSGVDIERVLEVSAFLQDQVEVDVPIVEGREYRFSLIIRGQIRILGRFGFVFDINGNPPEDTSKFNMEHKVYASGSVSRACPAGAGTASHALVMARYRTETSGGNLTAAVNGRAMTRIRDVEAADLEGQPCRAAYFLAEGQYSGSPQVRLSLSCQESNQIRLLSYAVLFL